MPDLVMPDDLEFYMNWSPTRHDRKTAILTHYKKSTEHYLICGMLLSDAERAGDWKHDGSEARSFFHWVDGELKIKRTQAQRMMSVWRAMKTILEMDRELVIGIDFTKLSLCAPVMEDMNTEQKFELLHMARENSFRDLQSNIKEMRGEPVPDTCPHDGMLEMYYKCLTCGKFMHAEVASEITNRSDNSRTEVQSDEV